jgi:hypothetical protein
MASTLKTVIGGGNRLDLYDSSFNLLYTFDNINATARTGHPKKQNVQIDVTQYAADLSTLLNSYLMKLSEDTLTIQLENGETFDRKGAEEAARTNSIIFNYIYYNAKRSNANFRIVEYGQGYFAGNTGDKSTGYNTPMAIAVSIYGAAAAATVTFPATAFISAFVSTAGGSLPSGAYGIDTEMALPA